MSGLARQRFRESAISDSLVPWMAPRVSVNTVMAARMRADLFSRGAFAGTGPADRRSRVKRRLVDSSRRSWPVCRRTSSRTRRCMGHVYRLARTEGPRQRLPWR